MSNRAHALLENVQAARRCCSILVVACDRPNGIFGGGGNPIVALCGVSTKQGPGGSRKDWIMEGGWVSNSQILKFSNLKLSMCMSQRWRERTKPAATCRNLHILRKPAAVCVVWAVAWLGVCMTLPSTAVCGYSVRGRAARRHLISNRDTVERKRGIYCPRGPRSWPHVPACEVPWYRGAGTVGILSGVRWGIPNA